MWFFSKFKIPFHAFVIRQACFRKVAVLKLLWSIKIYIVLFHCHTKHLGDLFLGGNRASDKQILGQNVTEKLSMSLHPVKLI